MTHKIKLFGIFTIFRKDVFEFYYECYFLGLWVGKYRKNVKGHKEEHITFDEETWYSVFCGGTKMQFPPNIHRNTIPQLPVGSVIRMNIERAIEILPNVNRIALVFFIGIGDYIHATPFVKKLKEKYSRLPFVAYVSNQFDSNNSPLVADCLRFDPNFDEIFTYNGVQNKTYWINYDYSEVVSREPETTLILPVIYDHTPLTLSRDDALCDTFCLPRSSLVPRPIIYDIPISDHVRETLTKVLEMVKLRNLRGVVWLQMKSRSADFSFNKCEELAIKLVNAGYFVLCVDSLDLADECCISLNLDQFRITDSIRLLQLINERMKTYCLTIASCFMAISSAFDIPNLAISFWHDEVLKSYYYPNLYIVTHKPYYCVPRMQQFLAPEEAFENDHSLYYQYKPDYLFECFQEMVESIENPTSKST